MFLLWLSCFALISVALSDFLGPVCPPDSQCVAHKPAVDDFFYTVRDTRIKVSFVESKYFAIQCPENVSLEDSSLPRFPRLVEVRRVTVLACRLRGSILDALTTLNVTALDALTLDKLPQVDLNQTHCKGLKLVSLRVIAADENSTLSHECMSEMEGLQELQTESVKLTQEDVLRLPTSLTRLYIKEAGLEEVPRAALSRLTHLINLSILDKSLIRTPQIEAAPVLQELTLAATVPSPGNVSSLAGMTLWKSSELRVLAGCSRLARLQVSLGPAPPPRWLASCERLQLLSVQLGDVPALPHDVLAGATQLQTVKLSRLKLQELPPQLFAENRLIETLDLSYNNLEFISTSTFSRLSVLRSLNLSNNQLGSVSGAALAGLGALVHLSLAHNPLGDLCSTRGDLLPNDVSPLSHLSRLRELSLSHTRATRLCGDYTRAPLTQLDLDHNLISELRFSELRHLGAQGGGSLTLDLRGNPVRAVHLQRRDYEAVLRATDQRS